MKLTSINLIFPHWYAVGLRNLQPIQWDVQVLSEATGLGILLATIIAAVGIMAGSMAYTLGKKAGSPVTYQQLAPANMTDEKCRGLAQENARRINELEASFRHKGEN